MKNLLDRCPAAYEHVTAAKNKRHALWRYRRLDWAEVDVAQAGSWLMRCTEELDFFDLDERGLPRIAPDHQAAVDRLREDLIERHEFHLPRRKRPKPWRDYRNGTAAFLRH